MIHVLRKRPSRTQFLLLKISGLVALQAGRVNEAFDTGVLLVKLGHRLEEAGPLICSIIGISCKDMGLDLIEAAIGAGLDAGRAAKAAQALEPYGDCHTWSRKGVKMAVCLLEVDFSEIASGESEEFFIDVGGFQKLLFRLGIFYKKNITMRTWEAFCRAQIDDLYGKTAHYPNTVKPFPHIWEGNIYGQNFLALTTSRMKMNTKRIVETEKRIRKAMDALRHTETNG